MILSGAAALAAPTWTASAGESLTAVAERVAPSGSAEARAAALHDFVRDEVKFGWASRFNRHDAEDTLRRRIGFCQTKSVLARDLMRAADLEARVVWAEIGAEVLRGIIDTGTPWLDHAYLEVRLGGEWVACDSYIVDAPLFAGAKTRLEAEGRSAGYGLHAEGSMTFPDFSQFRGGLRGRVWGVFETPEAFEAGAGASWNTLPTLVRLGFGLLASPANARAEALRVG